LTRGEDVTLRTTAIIAGALGLLMLITGWVSGALRADRDVVATANPNASIIVVGPDVLALAGLERIVVTGEGDLEAHTARPADLELWLESREAIAMTGFETWEELGTVDAASLELTPDPATANPSASASASPSASASASASPSPSPTAQPTASPAPTEGASEGETPIVVNYGAGDIWRESYAGVDRLAVTGTKIAAGEALVLFSADGSEVASVEFYAERNVNDAWIAPLTWIGAALAALGVFAFLSGVIDTRPAQERLERFMRSRRGLTDSGPRPGSRRERRIAGATLPEVSIAQEPDPVADYLAEQAQGERADQGETTTEGGAR
jgi:cell division septation protein DedD